MLILILKDMEKKIKYYFNLYDHRKIGWDLFNIDYDTYTKFKYASDDSDDDNYEIYTEMNILKLFLDKQKKYWVAIDYDYDCWTRNKDFKLYSKKPKKSSNTDHLFFLEYNNNKNKWRCTMITPITESNNFI